MFAKLFFNEILEGFIENIKWLYTAGEFWWFVDKNCVAFLQ